MPGKGRGFQAHPPTIEAHASRTEDRADQVEGHGQNIGSNSLHGQALGTLGGGTSNHANRTFQQAGSAVAGMSSTMRGHASTERAVAGRYRTNEENTASLFRAGNVQPRAATRGPQGGGSGGGPTTPSGAGPARGSSIELNGGRPYQLGSYNNPFPAKVTLDSHQNKHQSSPIPGLNPYSGGKGAKFPPNVDKTWHEQYFGPKAAQGLKGQYEAENAKLEPQRANVNRLEQQKQDLQDQGYAKSQQLQQATRQYGKNSPQVAQLRQEQQALATQYQSKKTELGQAQQQLTSAENGLKDKTYVLPKNTADEDGVKYDASMTYDHQNNQWDVAYHNNPDTSKADEASDGRQPGKTWWNTYGKGIASGNNLPGLT